MVKPIFLTPELQPDIPVSPAADALILYRAVTDQESILRQHYAGIFVDWALAATFNGMRSTLEQKGGHVTGLDETLQEMEEAYKGLVAFSGAPDDTSASNPGSTIAGKIKDTRELIADSPLYKHRAPLLPARWLPPVRFALALEARLGPNPDPARGNFVQDAIVQAQDLRSRLPGTSAWMAAQSRRLLGRVAGGRRIVRPVE